ncbi:MAG: hypothetical protein M3Y27_05530 [Acidobacteriota bacterium]|nr:hypothetical protein [Acidobacteriota bacterium]
MRALAAVWILTSMAAPPPDAPILLTSHPVSTELDLPELPHPSDRYALRVAGITVAPGNPALFRVFVDLPQADRSTPSDSEGHYVGQVSILAGPSKAPRNVIMSLTWPQRRKLSPGTKLRFTLVPLGDNASSPIRVQKLEITVTRA